MDRGPDRQKMRRLSLPNPGLKLEFRTLFKM